MSEQPQASESRSRFTPLPAQLNLPEIERQILELWRSEKTFEQLRAKNKGKPKFSFLDGPITANNPMGVHHAWGRTYKDLFQRFKAMQGYDQRYQNGFDCQGLWVEVEVEKELGFQTKRDIERYGIDRFVERCKARVLKFSQIITQQSIRLGQWMDWDNSYYTMSDENNYTIWYFLHRCHQRGLIYKGHDVMPWCARCGTAISDMEIATEGYKEMTHPAVYLRLPLLERTDEFMLVWTTTPWTLSSNVALAVHPGVTYVRIRSGNRVYYLARNRLSVIRDTYEILDEMPGEKLKGLRYKGPYDELPAQEGISHRVVTWDEVTDTDGTGIVHIAPGCGKEDFLLGQTEKLARVAPLDEAGIFLEGFGWLTGQDVRETSDAIFEDLRKKGLLYKTEDFTHRYPVCWRCGRELVFRLVDEWFIRMDSLRFEIMEVAKQVRWIPEFGLERELDWLRNMADWCISKKRYYGLALPIFECPQGHFDVIPGREELKQRAISGWEKFEGHSPHRPWVDEVKIACPECGEPASRIKDVGNPWLDAGIVPYSTMGYLMNRDEWAKWFPPDFITECFPGQYRNWFYAILTMSTVLENRPPFKVLLGHAIVRDENGEDMHKSKGNAIDVDVAAERVGADCMRWIFVSQPPANNLNFGFGVAHETQRKFLTFWNVVSFFVTYARIDGFDPNSPAPPVASRSLLDRWILSRLSSLTQTATERLSDYDPAPVPRTIEQFIDDLSVWYVRRSRRRFWKSSADQDKLAAYHTLYECLARLLRLMAPILPFLTEYLYQHIVLPVFPEAPKSVHLTDWPELRLDEIEPKLEAEMALVRHLVSLGHSARDKTRIKVRQPLARALIRFSSPDEYQGLEPYQGFILDELNVKSINYSGPARDTLPQNWVAETDGRYLVALDTTITKELRHEGLARELVRRLQNLRKEAGFDVADRIQLRYQATPELAAAITAFASYISQEVLANEMISGDKTSESSPVQKSFKLGSEEVWVGIRRL